GTDTVLERSVAVKVLASQFAGDEEFVERFRREARASAGLNHPNIVSVFDTGSDDGTHFIVMEQVRGRTLASILDEKAVLPPERAAAIASTVARALGAAHSQGLVHRDIKPGNVLITDAGEVKVTDFGIARAASGTSITMTGAILGTASYVSPEQAQGGVVDARSDVYSLGCVLYEMLAGRPPFTGASPVAIATQHVADDPVPPSSMKQGIPPPLEEVALRAMAKDPAERFASAAEMGAALDEAVGGEVTQGLPAVARGEPTQTIERRERTAVLPAVPPGALPRDRSWLPWVLAALALAVVGFLLARTLLGGEPASLVAPPVAPPTSASETTTPAPNPIATVEEAHQALLATIGQADSADGLEPNVAEELATRADEAVELHDAAEADQAQAKLVEAHQLLDAARVEGAVVDTWHAQITEGIATLSEAMAANPVAPAPNEGNGEGNGKGEGKAKGKDKGDGDEESD
ncbi:MAG TPA: protein kinase, partial [Actinomycetota bacterium]|nr:protein kinase [Actinomycetota bacterium]